jgi:hypothetical protein
MKKLFFLIICLLNGLFAMAQCAMCTKTAQGLNPEDAQNINYAIIYLALIPLGMMLTLAYLWYRKNKHEFVNTAD